MILNSWMKSLRTSVSSSFRGSPLLERIRFDYAAGWEDICFNSGPLLESGDAERLLLPRYRRIADLLRQHGVEVIWTDCDGNIMEIVDIWLEAGYNCMFPIEVRAGSDPVLLLRKIRTGRAFARWRRQDDPLPRSEAILAELKRLAPVVEEAALSAHRPSRALRCLLENYLYYHKEKERCSGIDAYRSPLGLDPGRRVTAQRFIAGDVWTCRRLRTMPSAYADMMNAGLGG